VADNRKSVFESDYEYTPEESSFLWGKNREKTGLKGVAHDVEESLLTAPGVLFDFVRSFPGEAYSSGKQAITNPGRAASNLTGGLMKGMRGMVNTPANINDYLMEKELTPFGQIPKVNSTSLENFFLEGEEEGDMLLRGLGEFSPFSRIGAGVKGLKGVGQRSGGAGLMALGDEEMNPIHAMLMGLAGEYGGKAAKKGANLALESNPITGTNQKLFKGIEKADVESKVKAARRLGLPYITPGEASGFGYVGRQEGKIGNTIEGSKLREKRAKRRVQSEEQVINDFLHELDDKIELPKQKKALYESVMSQELPGNFLGPYILENPVVLSAVKTLDSKPAYQQRMKGVNPDTFEYWDEVKRVLYDMESAEKRKGKNNLASSISESRRELIDKMDEIDPNYAKARKLGQRTILRREIEEGFDKKDMTGRNFYKNVIQSKKAFEKLYDDLSEFPDMQQDLLDMKLVFPDLFGTADAKAGVHLERTGVGTPRSDPAYFMALLKQLLNEGGDVKAVETITDPKWFERMNAHGEINAPGVPGKLSKLPRHLGMLVDLLTKSSGARQPEAIEIELAGED